MSVTYKITYEHNDGKQLTSNEVLIYSDGEPTNKQAYETALKDSVKFGSDKGSISIISVVPFP